MSDYGGYGGRRHRSRRSRAPEYVEETTYAEHSGNPSVRDLVYRPREDSIEDIPRDFPPPGAEYRRTRYREKDYGPRRARSVGRRDWSDDNYSDYGVGRRRRGRSQGRYEDYYSDYDRPRRERRKSKVGEVLEDLGLGSIVGAIAGRGRSESRDRRRYDDRNSRYNSSSRSRSRSRHGQTSRKWQQAAQAAIVAGAIEAYRSRKEPGSWAGEKGTRVATAALGAAGIDGLVDRDPDRKGKRHIAEAVIGGLAANRLANGARSRSRGRSRSRPGSRSRSRSRSLFRSLSRNRSHSRARSHSRGHDSGSSALKDIAGAGALAAAGKAVYDRVRSKSRHRSKSRNRSRSQGRRNASVSSEDSFAPVRSRRHGRRRDKDRGLAAAARRGSSASSISTTDLEDQRKKMRGKEFITAGLATITTIHAARGVYSTIVAREKRKKLVSEGEMTKEEARKRRSKNLLQDAAAIGIATLGIKSAFNEWKEMNEHRHTMQELEAKRRKRRKQREREREDRQNLLMNSTANPYGGYATQQSPYAGVQYADANPYSTTPVPPPPIGAPPARY